MGLDQLHGTWGGLAIIPEGFGIEVINEVVKESTGVEMQKLKDVNIED